MMSSPPTWHINANYFRRVYKTNFSFRYWQTNIWGLSTSLWVSSQYLESTKLESSDTNWFIAYLGSVYSRKSFLATEVYTIDNRWLDFGVAVKVFAKVIRFSNSSTFPPFVLWILIKHHRSVPRGGIDCQKLFNWNWGSFRITVEHWSLINVRRCELRRRLSLALIGQEAHSRDPVEVAPVRNRI